MFIQTEATPNPRTLKLIPGCPVGGSRFEEYRSAAATKGSPLASALFLVEGIEAVFIGSDFVTVTKADSADWGHVKPFALATLMDHFQAGLPVFADDGEASDDTESERIVYEGEAADIVAQIKDLIETRVRPAVANDGGDIQFHSWEQDTGIVRLRMKGSCAGCPSSTITLKNGIENMMRHYVPEVTRVEQVL